MNGISMKLERIAIDIGEVFVEIVRFRCSQPMIC